MHRGDVLYPPPYSPFLVLLDRRVHLYIIALTAPLVEELASLKLHQMLIPEAARLFSCVTDRCALL